MRGKAALRRETYSYCILLTCLLLSFLVFGCKKVPQEQVFELKEVSAFDVPTQLHGEFCRGQGAECLEKPDPNVTFYPDFVSDKPLFGRIHLPRELHMGLRGKWYYFALDKSDISGQDYDILYFDLNFDYDLINDEPHSVMKNPPDGALINNSQYPKEICFNFIDITFLFGDREVRSLEVMPRFMVDKEDNCFLVFVTTKAFTGKNDIAGRNYDVWLGHNGRISGWFDNPTTALHLIPDGDFKHRQEYRSNMLLEWHRIDGTDYRFSVSPSGEKLIVQPYNSEYGIIKTMPANRSIKNEKISGALYSGQDIYWLGGTRNQKPVSSFKIPVGDYTAGLEIFLDDLHLSTDANIHSDGQSLALIDGPHNLSVKIRKDEPFVLDFSNKPEVLFASPAKEHRLKPGEQLEVEAVLTDPKLDIMITDIEKAKSGFNFHDSDMNNLILYGNTSGIGFVIILWLLSVIIRSKRRFFLISAFVPASLVIGTTLVFLVISYNTPQKLCA